MLARFENGSIYRESQLAIGWDEAFCAHYDEMAKEDHSYVAAAEERKRREKSWVLAINSQGKMSGEGTRKSTPANKYGKERINRSQDPAKEQNESTRKLVSFYSLVQLVFIVVAITRQASSWDEQCFFFSPTCRVFRLQAVAILLQATWSVNTTPIPRTRRTSAHVIFLAWLKT